MAAALAACEPESQPDPDLNDDGVVNILDVSLAASCLGRAIPPPRVEITSPGDGSRVVASPLAVSGTVDDSAEVPCRVADIDADGLVDPEDFAFVEEAFGQDGFPVGGDASATVTVNGVVADVVLGDFSASVPLLPGPNQVRAEARDAQGRVGSDEITVILESPNSPPVADAGPDQTVFVNESVSLDGSGSSDADGDPLSFAWALFAPPGSGARLSDPGAVMPSFEVDLPGSYRAVLVVDDGESDSDPDQVLVDTQNSPPVADAGPDQTLFVTETALLDGSGSSDVDGDRLSFSWELLQVPPDSAAELSDPTLPMPELAIDRAGSYVARLIVDDGRVDSDPDEVTITTQNSPPVADAGPDQSPPVGDTVTLDGTGSSDVDGDPLRFFWSLSAVPPRSNAVLSDPNDPMPRFEVDVGGVYVATLRVNDGQADSDPDNVSIATLNSAPVADAGPDQTPLVGDAATLDGSGSSDVDGDLLDFEWSLTSQPAGSAAALSDPAAVRPSFDVDLPGTYVAQLSVFDGRAQSAPDTVALDTAIAPPVADAGPDQTVDVASSVTLDGSASSDVDGDRLGFEWSLTVQPGSTARLDDRNAVFPTFVADLPGTYVAQLIVNDGISSSLPDTVTIDTTNSAPVADAGPDQTARLTDTVTLDASGSSDADRDLLTQRWSFLALPPGSAAALSNRAAQLPTFVVDVEGTYVAQLIVDDGTTSSAPDSVVVSTINSAPVADAGPDQGVFVTESVGLDGSASDDVDGDPLAYRWSFTAAPAGSAAALDDPESVAPGFVVDLPGTYVVQLIVNDGSIDSQPNSVVVVTDNSPPQADAGLDQTVPFGSTVQLDGSGSLDADGDPIGFAWELLAAPAGSSAVLSDATSPTPSFVADVAGDYVARLVVNDGELDSAPDTVDIEVDPLPGILVPAGSVGAGLQLVLSAFLDVSNHGGIVVRVESGDPTRALVAADPFTPGRAAIDVPVPDGSGSVDFVAQGIAGAGGEVSLMVTAPGFGSGEGTLRVVQPAVALTALSDSLPLGVDDPFLVLVGLPDAGGTELASLQDVSPANGAPLAVSVTSSDPAVGQLFTSGAPAAAILLEIPTGSFQADARFRSLGGGTTNVSATAPGFLPITAASQDVTIELPLIETFVPDVGAGLQVPATARLGVADHGGVLVRIESSVPAVALVSEAADQAGASFAEVFVPNGSSSVPFVVQGVADRVGDITITLGAPGFAEGGDTLSVVQPGLALSGLSSRSSVGTGDGFSVLTGLPDGAGVGLAALQVVSAANVPPLVLTVTSSEGTVGQLSLDGTTAASLDTMPEVGRFQTDLLFTPLAAGATSVSASIPQFLTTNAGTVDVVVDPPGIALISRSLGAGLQRGEVARLAVSDHGGVIVRFESDDPSRVLVAPDANTPGEPFVDVFVPDGSATADYVVQGVAGAAGSAGVTASAPGFTDGTSTLTVLQPSVVISGLADSQSVGANDGFVLLIGLPNASGTGLSSIQPVSAGNAPPLVATLTSSDAAVGEVTAGGSSGGAVAIELAPGAFQLGASFAPLASGDTVVEVTVPGFLPLSTGSLAVNVTTP